LRLPSPILCSVPRRRREAPAAAAEHQPAARQSEFRLRALPRAACRPVGQEPESQSGPRQAPAPPHRGVRGAASSGCRRERASRSEWAWLREPVIPPEEAEARRDGRVAVCRGGQPAPRQAWCPEPALQSAQALSSAWGSLPAQASQDEPQAPRSEQTGSPWAQARAARKEPLPEVAAVGSASGEPQAAAWGACAAAAPRREAVSEPAVPRVAAVSGRAAADPQPVAAKAASERQAAVGAAAVPDGPQGAAEAEVAQPGAAAQPRAEVRRADEAVRLPAAVQPGARVPQAARPPGPSAAASVFRQDPSPAAAPERPRTELRLAHAMRCWPIASR